MSRHEVCRLEDIPLGIKRPFVRGGRRLLVFHLQEGLFATEERCPHLRLPLRHGRLADGGVLVCPHHGARFDVRSGRPLSWMKAPAVLKLLNPIRPPRPLVTYPVSVDENGVVFVELSDSRLDSAR